LDAAPLLLARCRLVSSSARKIVSGRRRFAMTTEAYEAFSIEEGDQVVIGGEVYRIVDILDGDETDYLIRLVDEEGNLKKVCANSHDRFRVVIDNLAEV
jgi:hypothetical protein